MKKFKTMWGGGLALNIGYTEGDTSQNAPARVWWNRHNDWNNRWELMDGFGEQDGTWGWYLWRNLYTKQCLAAAGQVDYAWVVQRPCDPLDDSQRWRFTNSGITNNYKVENLKVQQNTGKTLVLSQKSTAAGTRVELRTWTGNDTRQFWDIAHCGDVEYNNGHIDEYRQPEDC